jgi:hypothetical protein
MNIFEVRQSYIKERTKLWDKLQNCPCPRETKQLAKQYDEICKSYEEFLINNDLNDVE